MGKGRRIFGAVAALGVVGAIAFVAVRAGQIANVATGGKGSFLTIIESYRNPRGQFPGKDRVNILLVGKDYRYTPGHKGAVRYTSQSSADTILYVSLDLNSKKVSMLSVPRDIWLTAPDGGEGKINATYTRGKIDLLSRTVAEVTGVAPDFTIELKPDAVETIVDAVGGVDVETRDAIEYHDNQAGLHIRLPKGPQHLNGEQAAGFVRYRHPDIYYRDAAGKPLYPISSSDFRKKPGREIHPTVEDGDDKRQQRQQMLIRALIAEAKTTKNLMHGDSLINTALDQVQTKLKFEQMVALASMFRDIQPTNIQSGSLPGHDARVGRFAAVVLDKDKAKLMSRWLLQGDEAAANQLTTIAVQNGTKITGAAKVAAELLQSQGGFNAKVDRGSITAPVIDAAPTATPDAGPVTRIFYTKTVFADRAKVVASVLGGGQVMKDTTPGAAQDDTRPDILVVLGNDIAPRLAGERSASR